MGLPFDGQQCVYLKGDLATETETGEICWTLFAFICFSLSVVELEIRLKRLKSL